MEESLTLINQTQIISVIDKMLLYVDQRLVNHGERVAYIALELLRHADPPLPLERDKLIILSILHDIGAYKTEEIDEMVSFDSRAVWSHSIYGYLFLKYMSPIGAAAEAILYHHLDYQDYDKTDSAYLDYAALIYLADRIDVLIATSQGSCDFDRIQQGSGVRFCPEYVALFFRSQPEQLAQALRDGSYRAVIETAIVELTVTKEQAFDYLKMMVFSVDFRSEYTVSHTINTTAISIELGKRLGLSTDQLKKLYLGALLHDVGKVAISTDIVEFQGRLSPEQMEVMKQHVVFTRKIIEGLVDEDICRIAARHHEKLNGGGYPEGLTDADLTVAEKIVAVADIVSALSSKRSYKDAFPKEKVMEIVSQLESSGQLYPPACDKLLCDFDEIMGITDISRDPIIAVYKQMHQQYYLLNEKIQGLLKNSVGLGD